jgi:hypothetical protein
MESRDLYPRGRLGAPVAGPHGERPVHLDHALVERLRAIRAEGDEAMTAAEQYDPDFSVKLSACTQEADAVKLLTDWLERRITVLKKTQAELKHVWQEATEAGSRDSATDELPP